MLVYNRLSWKVDTKEFLNPEIQSYPGQHKETSFQKNPNKIKHPTQNFVSLILFSPVI